VEDHSGSSDMTQSIAAKVVVMTNNTMPGPLITRIFFPSRRSSVRSCWSDHLLRKNASTIQMMK
jgi:hypothetical protein